MKFYFFLFTLVSISFICSIGSEQHPVPDTAELNHLNKLALEHYRKLPDTSFYLAHKVLRISNAIDYKIGKANACNALAYTHLLSFSENDSALFYFNRATRMFEEMDDEKGMGLVAYGLGYVYSFKGNMKESEKSMNKSLKHFENIDYPKGICNVLNALSYIYKQYKDYDKAYEYINRAIEVAARVDNPSTLADLFNSLGNLYKDQALFQQAIDTYFNALSIWEEENDSSGLAIAYGSIGNMYYYQKDYKNALKYFLKKIPISTQANDTWEVSKAYNSMATVYNGLGKNDSALYYFKKGLKLNLQMNLISGIAESYYDLATTYFLSKEIDSATYYITKSIIITRNIGDRAALAKDYILLGKIHYHSKNNKLALDNTLHGNAIAEELGLPFEISDAADLLNKIYLGKQDYKKAYQYLLEYKAMQDSLSKDENIKKITRLSMQYEFDKKQRITEHKNEQVRQAHDASMKHQRMYLRGAIIFIILLSVFGLFYLRQKNLEAKFKTIELEQKLLRSQMNPHFIFNTLSAIQNFMLTNNMKEASHFLSKFAVLIRQILENSRHEYITIEEEVGTLRNYLEIQKLRFEKHFEYDISVDKKIDQEVFAIPPMLAQPFIENSIEHGLMHKEGKGRIGISFQLQNDLIVMEINDNGIGREAAQSAKEPKLKGKSMATTLTQERFIYLKKQSGKNIQFTLEDLYEKGKPEGTRVKFKIPFQKIYS